MPKALAHTKCKISLPFGGWTEGCPHSHGGVIDNTPLDPDTWNPTDWIRSGAGEVCEANGTVTAERNRGREQGLSPIQKDYLRPDFGNLVDEVTVVWGALLNDHITFQERILNLGSEGQTYGNTIYIAEHKQPRSTKQLTLLAHEFKHVQQYRGYGDLDTFCREYVRGLWGNGYEQNPLEIEAYNFDYSFALSLRERLLPFSPSAELYYHSTPDWNRRSRIELPSQLPGYIYFRNNCRYPLQFSLRYQDSSGNWRSEGSWNFEGNKSAYLVSEDQRLRSNNSIFYYYAEITQEPYKDYRWTGDKDTEVGGRTLPMSETTLSPDSDGDYVLSLSCSNL